MFHGVLSSLGIFSVLLHYIVQRGISLGHFSHTLVPDCFVSWTKVLSVSLAFCSFKLAIILSRQAVCFRFPCGGFVTGSNAGGILGNRRNANNA